MNLHSDILFYAFRYALGRTTYAVHDVAAEIIQHAKDIPESAMNNMIQEITEALEKDQAGKYMHREQWEKVLHELQQQRP